MVGGLTALPKASCGDSKVSPGLETTALFSSLSEQLQHWYVSLKFVGAGMGLVEVLRRYTVCYHLHLYTLSRFSLCPGGFHSMGGMWPASDKILGQENFCSDVVSTPSLFGFNKFFKEKFLQKSSSYDLILVLLGKTYWWHVCLGPLLVSTFSPLQSCQLSLPPFLSPLEIFKYFLSCRSCAFFLFFISSSLFFPLSLRLHFLLLSPPLYFLYLFHCHYLPIFP